jgi:squalene-hopene/tetraprenyl-beta-curcumene cyclase
LPFELAAFPHQLFGWLGLPVVSYALPALIAIGQVRHHHRPSANGVMRAIRNRLVLTRWVCCAIFSRLQAGTSATLTSFVVMSLASTA